MSQLDRQHPVRVILQEAALGNEPTKAFLDSLLIRDDLPEGDDLNRHRRQIAAAAQRVARIATPTPGSSNHGEARRQADHESALLAGLLTPAEAAITRTDAKPESLDDLGARMFRF